MMLRNSWFTLVRFGFRLLYNEMAWTYGAVSWGVSLGQWRQWQLAALPFVQGRRVLELGHGPGHMLLALQNRRFDVVGLDLSAAMGRQARRRTQRTVPLVRGMVQDLPFATAVFDTILATFPTDYIIDPLTLAAAHRVLRAHGCLVIVPEGHLNGQGHIVRFIDWLFTITGQRQGAFAVDDGHIWPADALWEPMRQRFAAAGFALTIERIQLPRSGVTVLVAEKEQTRQVFEDLSGLNGI
ncbi:MAG TPA: class I SAM-dependent methyltransferase [Chloroflexota bacterium]|nr:class I SAM-dependent methyltransferase [Chloroflexota bacterium]